jgi:tetratricopeptide (TPR) repeat protein
MYRVILCAVAALLVTAVQAATTNDRSMCAQRAGDEAIAACTRLLAINPRNAVAYNNRGNVYYRKGDYDQAISDFDQAIRLDRRYTPAYVNRGIAYNDKGDYGRAIVDYNEAIRLDPKLANTYLNRGVAFVEKGDYDRGISDYDQSVRLNPKIAFAYNNRGSAHSRKRDYERAIADYNQAIRLDPKNARVYNNRGEAYEAKNDPDHAMADFEQALNLDPSLEDARRGRERLQVLLAKQPNPGGQANAPASTTVPIAQIAAPANTIVAPVAVAPPDRRIALVIGMSVYADGPPLRNPASDARAVADAFRRLGFAEVIEREDLTRVKLEEVLKDFGDKAADADWAVIYYAGHGVEMNGNNYLVPVDAKLARAEHVEDETVSLTRVLSKTELAHKLRMVILDACRNNPFRMASADGRSRSIGRGLSRVEPARGVLVAYAARDGTTADDGDSGHSPFTQALLANLETPGLDIGLMFRRVRDRVLEQTNNAQEPFTYGSLPGEELYFKQAATRP